MKTYLEFLETQLHEGFNHIVAAQRAKIEAESRTPGTSVHYLSLAKHQNSLRLHHEGLASFHDNNNNMNEGNVHRERALDYARGASLKLANYHHTKAKELVNDDLESSVNHQMKGDDEMERYRKLKA